MKGFLIFLTVALVATSATPTQHKEGEKGIISDALALIKCLTEKAGIIQTSIVGVIDAVKEFEHLVEEVSVNIEACNALGGENPSIPEQIEVAQCLQELGTSISNDVTAAVDKIVHNVKGVIDGATGIDKCF